MSIVERALQKASALGRAAANAPAASPAKADAGGAVRQTRRAPAGKEGSPSSSAGRIELKPEALRAAGLAAPSNMDHTIAEELRLIKRPLLLNAEASSAAPLINRNLVMIGSALPGAGKTFFSLNLAMSMASELDWTVLLIDGDVTRPTLSRSLGLADAPGLINLLEQDAAGDVGTFAFETDLPRLRVLPAGPLRPNVKELLGSQRMRSFVEDLAQQQRQIVILDSPPLLLTSEARVLASYAGQIVLVVEAGVTPRRSVLEAIETLDATKAVNLVLNKNRQVLGIGEYQYAAYGADGRHTYGKTED